MTLKQAAQSALDVQTACNLSGVVRSFAEIVAWMRAEGMDTPTCNRHPVSRLYAEQICHLTGAGMGDTDTYHVASMECERLAAL
jgi:hypothetical protein